MRAQAKKVASIRAGGGREFSFSRAILQFQSSYNPMAEVSLAQVPRGRHTPCWTVVLHEAPWLCVSSVAVHELGAGAAEGCTFEDPSWEPECRALEAPNRLSGGPSGLQSLWNPSSLCAGQAPELTFCGRASQGALTHPPRETVPGECTSLRQWTGSLPPLADSPRGRQATALWAVTHPPQDLTQEAHPCRTHV